MWEIFEMYWQCVAAESSHDHNKDTACANGASVLLSIMEKMKDVYFKKRKGIKHNIFVTWFK